MVESATKRIVGGNCGGLKWRTNERFDRELNLEGESDARWQIDKHDSSGNA